MRLPTKDQIDLVGRMAQIYVSAQPARHRADKDARNQFVSEVTFRMLHGMMMGLTPSAGLQAYKLAQYGGPQSIGEINATPDETLRLVSNHPNYDWRSGKQLDAAACDLQFRRKSPDGSWEKWQDFRFTREMANNMDMTSDKGHKQQGFCGCDACQFGRHPVSMLRAKAVREGTRKYCPDVHGVEFEPAIHGRAR